MTATATPAPIALDNGLTLTHRMYGRFVLTTGKVAIATLRIVEAVPGAPRRVVLENRRGLAVTIDGHWQIPATAIAEFTAR
ncbi:hypothetical protein [Pseudonocardia sp. T1-2H]|uniref:hypothetical protein n=1 Tax=Pseudonocardia sp. T1-2H TaxID=3128899 RepID=UPI003101369B